MKLEKFVTIVFFAGLLVAPLQAQWNIGGVIDFNLASISVDPEPSTEDYSSRLGFGIGAVVDRPLSSRIDLHAEPMFLQKGGKIKEGGNEATFKVHYFEIPVMFRYTFENSGTAKPYAMVGPSFGFLLSAKADIKDGPEVDQKDETKGFDLGLGIGGGVKLPRGNKTFFAEARYVLGLSNINDEGGESDVKNRGLQVVTGVTFPIGSR